MKLGASGRSRMQLKVDADGVTLRLAPIVYCRREIRGCIGYWLRTGRA